MSEKAATTTLAPPPPAPVAADKTVTRTPVNADAAVGQRRTAENVDADCLLIIKIIFAFIFPPLAVGLECGCGCELLLNILLTLCGWVPGIIHALYVVLHCGDREPVGRDEAVERGEATAVPTVKA